MEENIVIDLNPNKVNIALLTYLKKTNVNIKYELTLNNDNLNIIFYLDDGINKEVISYQDLENALKNYIYRNDYEFKEFKYIGGIHKTGYYFDEDTPHYDGIKVYLKKKEKTLTYKKSTIN